MKNIYQAIFNIQKELNTVKKNSKNPHFGNTFANLEKVLETIMPYIQKNGLVVVQKPIKSEKVGTMLLRTEIIHVESSELIFAELELPLVKSDPQAAGSALTYARRYSLVTLLGLGAEDDDGEAAMSRKSSGAQRETYVLHGLTYTNIKGVGKETGKPYEGWLPPKGAMLAGKPAPKYWDLDEFEMAKNFDKK